MFKTISHLLLILMKPFNFALLALVYLLIAVMILPGVQRNIEDYAGRPVQILDLQMGYTVEKSFEILDTYTSHGREIYKIAELSAGLVFPLVYAFLFGTMIYFLAGKANLAETKVVKLSFIPFFAMLSDWVENLFIVGTVINYTTKSIAFIQIASAFSLLKWSSFLLIFLSILILVIYNLLLFSRIIQA